MTIIHLSIIEITMLKAEIHTHVETANREYILADIFVCSLLRA